MQNFTTWLFSATKKVLYKNIPHSHTCSHTQLWEGCKKRSAAASQHQGVSYPLGLCAARLWQCGGRVQRLRPPRISSIVRNDSGYCTESPRLIIPTGNPSARIDLAISRIVATSASDTLGTAGPRLGRARFTFGLCSAQKSRVNSFDACLSPPGGYADGVSLAGVLNSHDTRQPSWAHAVRQAFRNVRDPSTRMYGSTPTNSKSWSLIRKSMWVLQLIPTAKVYAVWCWDCT